jgi:uncharacterized membrane protein
MVGAILLVSALIFGALAGGVVVHRLHSTPAASGAQEQTGETTQNGESTTNDNNSNNGHHDAQESDESQDKDA